jgi:hypothetical protein
VIETHTRTATIAGVEVLAEASLNNCSSLWTATARANGKLIASGAGTNPAGALDSALEQAATKLAAPV